MLNSMMHDCMKGNKLQSPAVMPHNRQKSKAGDTQENAQRKMPTSNDRTWWLCLSCAHSVALLLRPQLPEARSTIEMHILP